jgi:glutamate racemase
VPLLTQLVGADVRIVDSASTCALHLRSELERLDMLATRDRQGILQIGLTDLSDQFEILARQFLHKTPPRIERVEL